jgi:hypothetical protein
MGVCGGISVGADGAIRRLGKKHRLARLLRHRRQAVVVLEQGETIRVFAD